MPSVLTTLPPYKYKCGTITPEGPQLVRVDWPNTNGAAQSVEVGSTSVAQQWMDSLCQSSNSVPVTLPAQNSIQTSYQSVLYQRSGQGITAEVGFDGTYYWVDWIDGSGQEQRARMNDFATAQHAVDVLVTQVSPAQTAVNYVNSGIQSVGQQITSGTQQTTQQLANSVSSNIMAGLKSYADTYGIYTVIFIIMVLVLYFTWMKTGGGDDNDDSGY